MLLSLLWTFATASKCIKESFHSDSLRIAQRFIALREEMPHDMIKYFGPFSWSYQEILQNEIYFISVVINTGEKSQKVFSLWISTSGWTRKRLSLLKIHSTKSASHI